MASSPFAEPYPVSDEDPFADAHRAVAAWIEDAVSSVGERGCYQDAELKSCPSGQGLLDGTPEQTRRYVVAAVAQLRYWEDRTALLRARLADEGQDVRLDRVPDWRDVSSRRRQAEVAIRALMRRVLPLQREDLLGLLHWCSASGAYGVPVGSVTRALERYTSQHAIDEELRAAMKLFAAMLRSSYKKDVKRFGTTVEKLCEQPGEAEAAADEAVAVPIKPPPQPAPAGLPGVLGQLKQLMRMSPDDGAPTTIAIVPDGFPLRSDSPLQVEHGLLSALFSEGIDHHSFRPAIEALDAGRALLALEAEKAGRVLLAAAERHVHGSIGAAEGPGPDLWKVRNMAQDVVAELAQLPFDLPREGLFDVLLYFSAFPPYEWDTAKTADRLLSPAERYAQQSPLTEGQRYALSLFRKSLIHGPPAGALSDEVIRITRLVGDRASFCLVPGETWTDTLNDDFSRMDTAHRRRWAALCTHAMTANSARPSGKWIKTAAALVAEIGGDRVHEMLQRWLPLVSQTRSATPLGSSYGDGAADTMNSENADCLRGLLWMVQTLPQPSALAREITSVALSAYKKIPGVGPRAVKVGNAAIYALSAMYGTDAVGQLAMLKVRVKFGTAQKEIEKAFNAAAEALGLPRDQIEEMGVPSYGLETEGKRCERLGEYRAELTVTGSGARLHWFDARGKVLKSIPAKVRTEHKEDLKELQQSLKDIQGMLPAQRDRIDSLFLSQKSWPIDQWRERYLDHPLIGTIARRLLWCVDGTAALFFAGNAPTDFQNNSISHDRSAVVTLWHPVGRSVEEILAWRQRLEALGITQPFKQAHREVYLLTDAERQTGTYSNRFAAHVLRQHQFNALCAARGWKTRLQMFVDDVYPPPTKELPQWGLRAEFWVEGIGEDYRRDTNEAGAYLRLATDQVRFYAIDAATNYVHASGGGYSNRASEQGQNRSNQPLPIEQVPPLVFSEVMRDVDLFVGVASVGNDPTWQDGGPDGRYRDYWQSYSFGELSGTAATRKQVLERLVPRLKIAAQCSFSDRFLIVRGHKRTYKIHLGSSNILMEPNDQYLCIVPDSRARAKEDALFLPFEGDSTLSIIISKALLLADDHKIKDPAITRQIDAR